VTGDRHSRERAKVGHAHVDVRDRGAADVGEDGCHVAVAQRFGSGQDQIGIQRVGESRASTATRAMSYASTKPTRPFPVAVVMVALVRMLWACMWCP